VSLEVGSSGLRSEINVTPLVDVMLVLLIIFMVVTPMLQRGKNVELPPVPTPEKQADDGKDIIVSVEYTGRRAPADYNVYVGSLMVDANDLRNKLADELRKDPNKDIYLKGDKKLTYGAVRKVMEACHEAGYQQVKLATEEIKGAESK
jgi:biopolymer transport protein TolR